MSLDLTVDKSTLAQVMAWCHQAKKKKNFKIILVTDGCDISSEITLRWTSLDLSDKSTVDQVIRAWRHQAITWTNVDLDHCCHMASLGHNELINDGVVHRCKYVSFSLW